MERTPEQILHALNPYEHTTDIVESSVRLERRRSPAIIGNAEQKIGAYLNRVEVVIGRPELRERLSRLAIKNILTQYDDIPESYWTHLGDIARDEGYDATITTERAREVIDNLQTIQTEGLEQWSSYFDAAQEMYPAWFVVYALENVARLADYNQEKQVYNRRSTGTIAPFPPLNPEAIAYTYGAIARTYNPSDVLVDATTKELVKNGSFNKLYSHFMIESKILIPLPETADKVYGEWVQYGPQDAVAIALAAEGTNWCIADPAIAGSYVKRYDSSFYFFHLKDDLMDIRSKSAVASIRIERGKVAEVSGRKGYPHQAVDDVLVDEVADKVFSLPGGAKYYGALLDKKKLIEMDEKFQDGTPFSIEELRFLYEVDRRIGTLNSYKDVRIKEFRQQKATHLQQLQQKYGAEAAIMVLSSLEAYNCFEELVDQGVPVDLLVNKIGGDGFMGSYHISEKVPFILAQGADPNKLMSHLDRTGIFDNLAILCEYGAIIDTQSLMQGMSKWRIMRNVARIKKAGVSDEQILAQLSRNDIDQFFAQLIVPEAINPNLLLPYLTPSMVISNLPALLQVGVVIDFSKLLPHLRPEQVARHVALLIEHGATIDLEKLMRQLSIEAKLKHADQLRSVGQIIDSDELLARLSPKRVRALRGWVSEATEPLSPRVKRLRHHKF
jgi:predicted house-cleaning noncanonical NTP pyrophosphatase (MazG superfamily)